MQKIKSALTGHSTESSTTGDRTSREYATGNGSGAQDYSAADRLTGDRSAVGSTNNTSGTSGVGSNNTTGTSGVTGTQGITGGSGHVGNSSTTSSTGDSLNPTGTGSGRYEETGSGREVSGRTGDFADPHKIGHDPSLASKFDPAAESTVHDHKHLQHVTHRDVRHVETEEVERQKEHERHIHHVQHHVQPIIDRQVNDEVIHEKAVPVTRIVEQHVNTDEDRNLFRGLGEKHQDSEVHRSKERTVVDLGEKVHEKQIHHVHHLTAPVIEQEVVDRHKIHTVIPTHHITHEAPIIHKSSIHEPISIADFQKGGGVLGSGVTMENAGVLQSGECSREVDGVGEKLAQELHLKSGTTAGQHASNTHI